MVDLTVKWPVWFRSVLASESCAQTPQCSQGGETSCKASAVSSNSRHYASGEGKSRSLGCAERLKT